MAPPTLSRRSLLRASVAGAVAATAACAAPTAGPDPAASAPTAPATEPFFGAHQSGIATPAQAHATYLALDLHPATGLAGLRRMLRLLSDDAARLTQGRPPLADTEPELALATARLTVTFGLGPRALRLAPDGDGLARLLDLPEFATDRLEQSWCGGDVLLLVCGDDPTTVAHARRMLWKDARAFASVRWGQDGFLQAPAGRPPGATPRNLMGQVDGTVNPRTREELDRLVWISRGPLAGGTTMVVRRIRLDLERWDLLGRREREDVVGRRLDTGAPLTGSAEHDPPDLAATLPSGLPVIADFAHVRRARGGASGPQMLRRGYNYDRGISPDGSHDAGLVFTSFQADISGQFVPVQQRLANLDLLNRWAVTVGSATFAVPPGAREGGWVGQGLLG